MNKSNGKKEYNSYKLKIKLIITCIILIILGSTLFIKSEVEIFVNSLLGYEGALVFDSSADLKVHFIDVGQGDSIAIELPDGKNMLIDAGTTSSTVDLKNYLDKNIFDSEQEKVFDYVILTHSDADHSGGMAMIYNNYQVNYSYRPYEYSDASVEPNTNIFNSLVHNTLVYKSYVSAVYDEPNSIVEYSSAGETISGYSTNNNNLQYKLTFITPNETYYSSANDNSSIILLEYNDRKILLTGDASEEGMSELYNARTIYDLSNIDIYKASHHGSASNDCNKLEVLQVLQPTFVVISVGENNSYGHPSSVFLENLSLVNVNENNIYRTDFNGTIVFSIMYNSNEIGVKTDVSNKPLYLSWLIIVSIIFIIINLIIYADYIKNLKKYVKKYKIK